MKMIWISSLIVGSSVLLGCNSQIDAVNQEMAQIRSQAPAQVEPAPTFTAVPSFEYAAQSLRSPFVPSSVANELKMHASRPVQPNLHRKKHPLEDYALEELYMKGHLAGQDQTHAVALLQIPDGQLEQVRVGDYIGQHQGRIIKIQPTRIDLLELLDDGRGGFIQRPRSLMLMSALPATVARDTAQDDAQQKAATVEVPDTQPRTTAEMSQ